MNIISLSYEGQQVRFVGTAEDPAWVATDVCYILDIKNHRDALSSLDEDEKDAVGIPDAIGRIQDTLVVKESGLYALCFKSRKPEAKKFRKWVTKEVLPSIRKYGCYPPPASDNQDALAFTLQMLKLAGVSEELQASFALAQKAKLDPANAVVYEQAKQIISTRMILEEIPVSPTRLGKEIAQQLNLSEIPSAQKVNEALLQEGLQTFQITKDKRGKKRKEWQPTEAGKAYSQVLIDTAPNHGKTISKLSWFTSVIPLIQKHFSTL